MGAAEQQQFSQYPHRYGDGTLGAAIAQTRGGKDELITPVALWELDDGSGLYLPPGLSANPRRPRVDAQLSGSIVEQVMENVTVTAGSTYSHPEFTGMGDYKTFAVFSYQEDGVSHTVSLYFKTGNMSNTRGKGYEATFHGGMDGIIEGDAVMFRLNNLSGVDASFNAGVKFLRY